MSISSADPALMGASLTDELRKVASVAELTRHDVAELQRNWVPLPSCRTESESLSNRGSMRGSSPSTTQRPGLSATGVPSLPV